MIDRLPRRAAVAATATAGQLGLLAWLGPLARSGPLDTLDQALVRGCAALALLAGAWLWLGVVVTAVTALRERPAGTLPAPLRRLVLAACGVALAGGLAVAPAHATPGHPREDRVAAATRAAVVVAPDPGVVTVAPGDTLWTIAARTLAADAPDADVDARWRRIYLLNRAEIGPDPDLIHPAQRLRVPTSEVLP